MNIYEKLLNIQNALKCNKSQYNSFGKYYYRSCEDILEAVKPICQQHGAVLTVSDEIALIGERFYIKATATLIDVESGERVSATAFAREEQDKKGTDASQLTGSCSSYARKYTLNGLFCIDDTKDADGKSILRFLIWVVDGILWTTVHQWMAEKLVQVRILYGERD